MLSLRTATLTAAILLSFVFCSIAVEPGAIKLRGHVPPVVAGLTPLGRLPATNNLSLAIGLPLRNRASLGSFLHELYDPASTNYHHYLAPEQFTERFGPTEQDYQAVIRFAATNSLTVTRTHANRVLLDVNGEVSDIESAFHITLRTYRHPTEARDFYAPDTEPSVTAGLPILDISGLSDFAEPKPMLRHRATSQAAGQNAAGSAPYGAYMGNDFRTAYVPDTALNGFGQMVGLVEFTGYDPTDIFAYEAQAGLPNVHLQNVLMDGASGLPSTVVENDTEICLDIEMAIAMATNLDKVVVFEALYRESYLNDELNTMAASNQIKQFSCSWGFYAGPDQTTEQILQEMAAQGQSFFQASGDGDAWTSPILQPAESPNLTLVGGTTLFMNGSGTSYQSEEVWNSGNLGYSWDANGSTNDFWGSGGGVSPDFQIPYWQTNVVMTANLGSTTMRNIPDVALTADNVYVTCGSGTNQLVSGTSCAAPLWAGFMALVNQQAADLNNPPAGFINPAIYALGGGSNYTACFHDITTGSNAWPGSPDMYFAVPGYDLCTGWGTPAGTNLINALAGGAPDPLVVEPLGGFVALGESGGPFCGTSQTFSLNNGGAGSLNWSLINTSAWLTVSQTDGALAAGGQTNVTVSLAPAANGLPAGTYAAGVWFSNQATHVAQLRVFLLQPGQSLVQDGGFESGTFSYWTLTGNTIIILPSGPLYDNAVLPPNLGFDPVHSGTYGALLGDTNLALLSQMLPTIPGQNYLLSLWLENPSSGPDQFFEVNWNTNSAATNTIYSLSNPPSFTWTNYNFVLAATATNTTLEFGAENPPNYFGLDDVSVTPVPAPSFAAVNVVSNGLALTWNAVPQASYVLQYTTNLVNPNWQNLGPSVTAASNAVTQVDASGVNAASQRFYRVALGP